MSTWNDPDSTPLEDIQADMRKMAEEDALPPSPHLILVPDWHKTMTDDELRLGLDRINAQTIGWAWDGVQFMDGTIRLRPEEKA